MSFTNQTMKNIYSGDGVTASFAFSFPIQDQTDLLVEIKDSDGSVTAKTLTTHYTVNGTGNRVGFTDYTSGNVVFTAGNIPLITDTIILGRDIPATQPVSYPENDPFPAKSHERALDKLTMLHLQEEEKVDRCAKFHSNITFTGHLPDPSADKYIKFNSAADSFEAFALSDNAGIGNVVDDTSPQLGGDLDTNDKKITNATGDITLKLNTNDGSEKLSVINSDSNSVFSADSTGVKDNMYMSVKSFGAVGDGVADDTTAVQNALNKLQTLEGTLFFPPGTYKITSTVTCDAQNTKVVKILGKGNVKLTWGGGNSDILLDLLRFSYGCEIGDFILENTNQSTSATGIRFTCWTGSGTSTSGTVTSPWIHDITVGQPGDLGFERGIQFGDLTAYTSGEYFTYIQMDRVFTRHCNYGVYIDATTFDLCQFRGFNGNGGGTASGGTDADATSHIKAVTNVDTLLITGFNSNRCTGYAIDLSGGSIYINGGWAENSGGFLNVTYSGSYRPSVLNKVKITSTVVDGSGNAINYNGNGSLSLNDCELDTGNVNIFSTQDVIVKNCEYENGAVIKQDSNTLTVDEYGLIDATVSGNKISGGAASVNYLTVTDRQYVRVRMSANQSITNATNTKVQFNTEDSDAQNIFDSSTNYRYTPDVSGMFLINAQVEFENVDTDKDMDIYIYKNGTSNYKAKHISPLGTTNQTISICAILSLNGSSDYIEVFVRHTSAAARNIIADTVTTFMEAVRIH